MNNNTHFITDFEAYDGSSVAVGEEIARQLNIDPNRVNVIEVGPITDVRVYAPGDQDTLIEFAEYEILEGNSK